MIGALNKEAARAEAVQIMRSLIDDIRLVPEDGALATELALALSGILVLTQNAPRRDQGRK